MTTSQSPLRVLKAQADIVARNIKMAERGEPVSPEFDARAAASKARGEFVAGIVMDDKLLMVTLPWAMIRETSEVALSAYILKYMRGERVQ